MVNRSHRLTRIVLVFSGVAASLAVACTDAPVTKPPAGGAFVASSGRVAGSPNRTTYDASSRTLGVGVIGLSKIPAYTMEQFYVSLSGGQGPYYVDWFQSDCESSGCTPLTWLDGGWDKDTVYASIMPQDAKIHIVAHVYDSEGVPFSGSYDKIAINTVQPGDILSTAYSCDLGPTFYPVLDYDGRHFRRDACTGEREYAP